MTTSRKKKIGLPPVAVPLNSPEMLAVIGKGGSVRGEEEKPVPVAKTAQKPETVVEPEEESVGEDILKSFTIKIYESELAKIRKILERLPKRDRISIHDFIVKALNEKITRDTKKATK